MRAEGDYSRAKNGVSSSTSYSINENPSGSDAKCAVCGDGRAKLHYGILACYGCKGFFRRTLAGKYRYICRFAKSCTVDKYQRNSCRYCRFRRCLDVGMNPKAVRPDRDLTGRQKTPRLKKRRINSDSSQYMEMSEEAKNFSMQLLSIDSKIAKEEIMKMKQYSDTSSDSTLWKLFERKSMLDGRRMEVQLDSFHLLCADEIHKIMFRRAMAAVEWVNSVTDMADATDIENKITLVKSQFALLTIFDWAIKTVKLTKNPDILCFSNCCFVPRKLPTQLREVSLLSDNFGEKMLNDVVIPIRRMNLKQEEIVALKSIILLDPNIRGLSSSFQSKIEQMRDLAQETLFELSKEWYPVNKVSSRFGNILLLIPTITLISGIKSKCLNFLQAFNGPYDGENAFDNSSLRVFEPVNSSPPSFENPADITLQEAGPQSSLPLRAHDHLTDYKCNSRTHVHFSASPNNYKSSNNLHTSSDTSTTEEIDSLQSFLNERLEAFTGESIFPDVPIDCGDIFLQISPNHI